MDTSILWQLTYGMYAIGTMDGERPTGCIANTLVQITSKEPIIALSMNKNNFTYEAIKRCGHFSVSILTEDADPGIIAELGFTSGRDHDKFQNPSFNWEIWLGLPVITESASGYIQAEVISTHDMKTHCLIFARVTNTRQGTEQKPMTYKYYHENRKGLAPKNAPTYQPPKQKDIAPGKEIWICSVCGYIYEGNLDQEADTFRCPICRQPKSAFIRQITN